MALVGVKCNLTCGKYDMRCSQQPHDAVHQKYRVRLRHIYVPLLGCAVRSGPPCLGSSAVTLFFYFLRPKDFKRRCIIREIHRWRTLVFRPRSPYCLGTRTVIGMNIARSSMCRCLANCVTYALNTCIFQVAFAETAPYFIFSVCREQAASSWR